MLCVVIFIYIDEKMYFFILLVVGVGPQKQISTQLRLSLTVNRLCKEAIFS